MHQKGGLFMLFGNKGISGTLWSTKKRKLILTLKPFKNL